MKKRIIVVALMASAFVTGAQAAAGKINFVGSITEDTCTIGSSPATPMDVPMLTYGSNEFTAAGQTTPQTEFTIELTACPAAVTKAAINFNGTKDTVNPQLLQLTPGGAAGLGIQLYDEGGAELAPQTNSKSYTMASGDNALKFYAAYKSTAATVTGGAANSATEFSVIYN